jgi:endoglucanase
LLIGNVFFYNNTSELKTLDLLWINYKNQYFDKISGRTIDEQREGITTSEGQSYTMLRSVWSNDKETFDSSWKWTKENLTRNEDNLFSWLWGKRADNSYGIIFDKNGQNVAIDADIDIAYALILASKKWKDDRYLAESKKIITDIWSKTVIISNSGKLILASNNVEKQFNKTDILVNPSYFSVYAFNTFAKINPDLEWNRLADDCYYFLNKIHDTKFIDNKKAVLPPDWIIIDKNTLDIKPRDTQSTIFGYDAVRIPWRVALDYKQNPNPKSLEYINKLGFLDQEFTNKNLLYTVYDINGNVTGNYESILAYSTVLGYFDIVDRYQSQAIIENKIKPRLTNDLSYYDSNWLWFGLALHYDTIL